MGAWGVEFLSCVHVRTNIMFTYSTHFEQNLLLSCKVPARVVPGRRGASSPGTR